MNKVLLVGGAVTFVTAFFLLTSNVVAEDISLEEQIQEEIYEGYKEELAILVYAEAGNQTLEGKQRVADVVLNRVKDPNFPNTIHEVIYQKGQFSVMTNGAYEKAMWDVTDECFEAVRLETECADDERLDTKSVYFSRGKSKYGTNWYKCGDHWFGERKN